MTLIEDSMTAAQLIEKIQNIAGADDLPVKIANYEGDHGMKAYTIRKHVVTDEEDAIIDAYLVING